MYCKLPPCTTISRRIGIQRLGIEASEIIRPDGPSTSIDGYDGVNTWVISRGKLVERR